MSSEQKRWGLIVGTSSYVDSGLTPIPTAKNDAVRLRHLLLKYGNFEPERIHILYDDSDDEKETPTKSNILSELTFITNSAGEDDLVLFFFAGHGVEVSDKPYLLAKDTRMNVLDGTALDIATINAKFQACKARHIVRFFDCCRSPFGEGRGTIARMGKAFQESILRSGKGWASFSACSSGESAFDYAEVKQGVFSYYLCEGLEGKAAAEEGSILFESLVAYVKASVMNWCTKQSLMQTPNFAADLSGPLVIARTPAPSKEAPPTTSPFYDLSAGLDSHLSQSDSVRGFVNTDKTQLQELGNAVVRYMEEITKQFAHPAMTIEQSTAAQHDGVGNAMRARLREADFHGLACFEVMSHTLFFKSRDLVVPEAMLSLYVCRMPFFYFIWFCCSFHKSEGLQGFNPKPPSISGHFLIKPSAVAESAKIGALVGEIMARLTPVVLDWATQLRQYFEDKIGPFRASGPIIE